MEFITERLLSGLHGYEIVMLFLGAFLFLVLSFKLIKNVLEGEKTNSIVFSFVIPIIMMGFPGIQEISFENGKVSIKNKVTQILDGAESSKEETEDVLIQLDRIADRAKTLEDIFEVSTAYLILEKPLKASQIATKGLEKYKDEASLLKIVKIAKYQNIVQEDGEKTEVIKDYKEQIQSTKVLDEKTKKHLDKKYIKPAEFKKHNELKETLFKDPTNTKVKNEFRASAQTISARSLTVQHMIDLGESYILLDNPVKAKSVLNSTSKDVSDADKVKIESLKAAADIQEEILSRNITKSKGNKLKQKDSKSTQVISQEKKKRAEKTRVYKKYLTNKRLKS